jgi:pimeloyl-ACP methyl ester carboxylesterase
MLPYIDDIDCVAIDLAGHGKSGARNGHSAYNVWEDLKDIRAIVDKLGWDTFTLLGHSRGAAISTLYAGTFPEEVNGAFLIDGIFPSPAPSSELPKNLAVSIREMQKTRNKTRRRSYFETFDDAVAARMGSNLPVSKTAATLFAERSVLRDPDLGYYWNYDQRLLVPSEIRLTREQSWAFLDALSNEIVVVAASNGFLPKLAPRIFAEGHDNVALLHVEGDHHLHVLDDEATRQKIARSFTEYLEKHA